jgi:hypothetical protein
MRRMYAKGLVFTLKAFLFPLLSLSIIFFPWQAICQYFLIIHPLPVCLNIPHDALYFQLPFLCFFLFCFVHFCFFLFLHIFSPFPYCFPLMALNFEIRLIWAPLNIKCSHPNASSWTFLLKDSSERPFSSQQLNQPLYLMHLLAVPQSKNELSPSILQCMHLLKGALNFKTLTNCQYRHGFYN